MLQVAIFMFDGVEVLDFAAPFEVFTYAGQRVRPGSLEVRTVAARSPITARNGLIVCPPLLDEIPVPDVLILPGGLGVEEVLRNDAEAMAWISSTAAHAQWTMSICTGAFFLAHCGLLKGRRATTHFADLEGLKALEPTVELQADQRFVHEGRLITSAGISAGLDASLYLVAQILGREAAQETARWLEYHSTEW
jgi:transcriptional regulator GlxA family with amidase domain